MKTLRHLIILLLALTALLPAGCISDDIDPSPGLRLGFSTDTVRFGTLFSGVPSPTARLIVRNPNKKGVMISSIRMRDDDGVFRLNVDGVSGYDFRDVEIRGKDSIYVYIECLVDAGDSREPVLFADRLDFTLNGHTQEVEVEAVAQNAVRLDCVTFSRDTVLGPELPYLVTDTLTVAEGAVLRLQPGVQLLFHDKAGMTVHGTLEAIGEPGRMVEMRGDRLDNVLPGVPYDIMAGQWRGIDIRPESFGNRLEYVDMRSTSEGLRVDSCGDLTRNKLTLLNSWLHNSQTQVLNASFSAITALGTCFSDAPLGVVTLRGGDVRMVQCTVANQYLFAAVTKANLTLEHCKPAADLPDAAPPLMTGVLENCIIYGLGSSISPGDLTGADFYLKRVLLKEDGKDDDNFINCLWDIDPMFLTVRNDYYFNYRLAEDSPVLHSGMAEYVTPECLYDMDGIDRLAGGDPALGAYAQ